MQLHPESPRKRGPKYLGYVLFAVFAAIVVALATVWPTAQISGATSPGRSPPPFVLVMVKNGTDLTLTPSGFKTAGPFDLTNNSEWTVSGAWWESNGTTDCFVTSIYYSNWNKSDAPVRCDGWGFYGSPGDGGYWSMGTGWALSGGNYYLVWFNLSPTTSTWINVTAVIEAMAIGGSCNQQYPPLGC
jgi:hypothetical protein